MRMKAILKRYVSRSVYSALSRYYKALGLDLVFDSKSRWIRSVFFKYGQSQRDDLLIGTARFLQINRPIDGYYFEFGCNEANTMRKAWDSFRYLFDLTYVGFDSFEGLPEIEEIDKQMIWEKGKLRMEEEDFRKVCKRHGIPNEKLKTVKGFYEKSLTKELAQLLGPKKAAVVYIDCDLYMSTVPVLAWIKDFLQIGTVVIFDDWNCFCADPAKGERRAWREFIDANPDIGFEDFMQTAEGKSFICTRC